MDRVEVGQPAQAISLPSAVRWQAKTGDPKSGPKPRESGRARAKPSALAWS